MVDIIFIYSIARSDNMGESEFLKKMGQRISLRRKTMHLTQEELADKMGVSTQMISNLELGKKAIRPENLAKLCSVLELSADFVLAGSKSDSTVNDIAEKLVSLSSDQLQTLNSLIDCMISKK